MRALLTADLAEADLAGADLAGTDFSGQDLSGRSLVNANLTGANLAGTVLYEADLSGAELMGADLTGAVLTRCIAHKTGFGNAELEDADLSGADATGSTFSMARLRGTCLQGATLAKCRFVDANLKRADFTGADLQWAELINCPVDGASFRDTDLRSARVRRITGYPTSDWVGADMRGAEFSGASLLRRFALDQNYLEEFKSQSRANLAVYWVWKATSDCGRSLALWGLWTLLIAAGFAWVYRRLPIDYGDHETPLSPLYFSVVTLTTLGYGDALPTNTMSQAVVMAQVVVGYVMLGGLLSIVANKLSRRAN